MSDTPKHGFDTLQVHAGAAPDPATGARQTPIYQTTAFAFRDADHAAKLFNLEEIGYIYSRLTNPTVSALQDRVTALEGGAGAVACSSGHAAQIMALFPLLHAGDNIVVSPRLYGGTVTQFSQTIKRFGWEATFVDFDDLDAVKAGAIRVHCRMHSKGGWCVQRAQRSAHGHAICVTVLHHAHRVIVFSQPDAAEEAWLDPRA